MAADSDSLHEMAIPSNVRVGVYVSTRYLASTPAHFPPLALSRAVSTTQN